MDLQEKAISVLRASRSFGTLEHAVLVDLAHALTFEQVAGGEQVYREGAPSDSMLFVVSGNLRVSRRDAQGELSLYNEVRPGQSVGEVGLILQQPRTADVTAVRDSTLAMLRRGSYEALLLRHPLQMNKVFVQVVYDFLRHTAPLAERQYAQSFAIVPLHPDAGGDAVADALATAFSALGRVHRLRPPLFGEDIVAGGEQLDELESAHEFLVYQTDADASSWTRCAFRQADQIIFVARAGASRDLGEAETCLTGEPGFNMKRKHLVLLHPSDSPKPVEVAQWRGVRHFERIYPMRSANLADYARLARFMTGTAVGVVLGGGGARGFAHLGVLQALEEQGIPVDLIGGNSMGALIGAQYACDVPLAEIRRRTQKFATGGERLTLPVISIVSGKRVKRDLHKMFGDTQIDELWRPFFAAACNLSRGETTVQDRGPLWRAVLASNSPAGLFPPVLSQGDLLVDGAILENVPVEAMRARLGTPLEKRRGNGTIIAIDVDVRDQLGADPELDRLSVWSTVKGYFAPTTHPSPSIASILYSAGHIGGAAQRARTVAQADHYLEPPVAQFSLMAYRRSQEIVDVGYGYAKGTIEQWKLPPKKAWATKP
ncbi:MAG: cyclic nucleotide-binding and patatin-like phospholipase domain-containing protein [Pseudomonadota bacterium]